MRSIMPQTPCRSGRGSMATMDTESSDNLPFDSRFGGVKRSGHGREKGFKALYGFSCLKTIAIQHD